MLIVHCFSTINSLEKDTVFIQFFDCLYNIQLVLLMWSVSQYSVLFSIFFHFVFFHSSDFFKSEVQSYVYGTMINWSTKKEINANVYCCSLCMGVFQTFPPSFEWHLTPHMMLSIKTCIMQTPCIKRTFEHSPRVFS